VTWTLPDPVLTTPTPSPDLPPGHAAEPKWDGYRTLAHHHGDQVLLRSRHGTNMTAAFPEIRDAALQLPNDTALDGELVVWEAGRLAFERLQQRMARRGKTAVQAAREMPAHYVAFDLLRLNGTDTTAWPYTRRRVALEHLFTDVPLTAPFTLSPSTTDPDTAREWLTWTSVGVEGLVIKRLTEPYRPGARTWRKYKPRAAEDAIVGAVTGPPATPRTLLVGRHDPTGRFRFMGRTTPLSRTAATGLADLLTLESEKHPWEGRSFSGGWGSREALVIHLVRPDLVVEVAVDVARDAAGRWRHPVRLHRVRPDLTPDDVPPYEASPPG
jgi:ATP-dependent DNA ligase